MTSLLTNLLFDIFHSILILLSSIPGLLFERHTWGYTLFLGLYIPIFVTLGVLFVGHVIAHLHRDPFARIHKTERVVVLLIYSVFSVISLFLFLNNDRILPLNGPLELILDTIFLLFTVPLGLLGFSSLVYFFFYLLSIITKKIDPFKKLQVFLFLLVVVSLLGNIFVIQEVWFGDGINGSTYFTLHAAIKNTCLLDPKQENCPQTLEELRHIEPAEYDRRLREAQLIYRYYPETNDYTFIVRYQRTRAIIFDQRLKKVGKGTDFKEVNISTFGKDRIIEVPPFRGPWDEIKEWNR